MIRISLVGRPNVGKSSLFNRLTGKRSAIVHDQPGVTRDRRFGRAKLYNLQFELVDTAGLELQIKKTSDLQKLMEAQTLKAIEDSDIILFMFDAQEGVSPIDEEVSALLRRSPKPVFLLGNKAEGLKFRQDFTAFKLGLGDPLFMSAVHGEGLQDLYHMIAPAMKKIEEDNPSKAIIEDEEKPEMSMVIVGRPNVGKSTLVNQLLGEDRQLTGPMAGLTRDSIAVDLHYKDHHISLVDTAGQRKKANVKDPIEKLSVFDALHNVKYSNVVTLVLDASQTIDKQDFQIARHILDEGRALVIALNKWDLVKDTKKLLKEIHAELDYYFASIKHIPLVPISAITRDGVAKLMEAVFQIYKSWNIRLTTGKLNQWLRMAVDKHPPQLVQGRRIKIKYATQAVSRPPTFTLFTNMPNAIPEEYKRFLINSLRETFNLPGIPLRINFKGGDDNPYHTKGKK